MIDIIHKVPILTTILSGIFAYQLYHHWTSKNKPDYLFWWMLGVICYGLGTVTESIVGLVGWSPWVFKAWYILGALLGGFPLAQGSVFLMMNRSIATWMMVIIGSLIVFASAAVVLSPLNYELVEETRLTGKVLGWTWIRYITPIINIYAFIFLVGGAGYSAFKYSKDPVYKNRFHGNLLIALGGLLPGIGGSFTKFGYTEVLYVAELLGIILIYCGYLVIRRDTTISVYQRQRAL
jgi:hypothetical protein